MKVFSAAFMWLQFGLEIFWQKDFDAKAAHKIVKLTPGQNTHTHTQQFLPRRQRQGAQSIGLTSPRKFTCPIKGEEEPPKCLKWRGGGENTLLGTSFSFSTCGLYYKHIIIVNYDSSIINKFGASLTGDARVIIYDRQMFIVQATWMHFHVDLHRKRNQCLNCQ